MNTLKKYKKIIGIVLIAMVVIGLAGVAITVYKEAAYERELELQAEKAAKDEKNEKQRQLLKQIAIEESALEDDIEETIRAYLSSVGHMEYEGKTYDVSNVKLYFSYSYNYISGKIIGHGAYEGVIGTTKISSGFYYEKELGSEEFLLMNYKKPVFIEPLQGSSENKNGSTGNTGGTGGSKYPEKTIRDEYSDPEELYGEHPEEFEDMDDAEEYWEDNEW